MYLLTLAVVRLILLKILVHTLQKCREWTGAGTFFVPGPVRSSFGPAGPGTMPEPDQTLDIMKTFFCEVCCVVNVYHVVVVHISVCIKVCIYVQVRYTRRVMVSLEYVNVKE